LKKLLALLLVVGGAYLKYKSLTAEEEEIIDLTQNPPSPAGEKND